LTSIDAKDAVAIHRAVARILAHLLGTEPELVWGSYETFEADSNILVDILGVLEDSAKPFLEMRERVRVRSSAIKQAASRRSERDGLGIVDLGSTPVGLDGTGAEHVELDSRAEGQPRVEGLDDEE